MGHTPNAKKGLEILTDINEHTMQEIAMCSDIAMARQERDRDSSIAAVKNRHKKEVKALKETFRNRAKKIASRMKEFEDMSPVDLTEKFRNGVPEDLFNTSVHNSGFSQQILNSRLVDFEAIKEQISEQSKFFRRPDESELSFLHYGRSPYKFSTEYFD